MSSVRIPVERFRKWISVLKTVEKYSYILRREFGKVTIILHGSYARGDFNLWSDVDLIIISDIFHNTRPLDRYNLLPEQPPLVEPILLTPIEFIKKLEKPSWIQMLMKGAVIIIDDYKLSEKLASTGIKTLTLKEILQHIHKLKTKYTEQA